MGTPLKGQIDQILRAAKEFRRNSATQLGRNHPDIFFWNCIFLETEWRILALANAV